MPRARLLYREIGDFLTSPGAYALSLRDARDLEQIQRIEIGMATADVSVERDAEIRARLSLLGASAKGRL